VPCGASTSSPSTVKRRVSLDDDVQLLLAIRARPELVVLADHVLAGLRLVRGARAEGAYVERAAEADVHPVAVTFARLLGKRKNAVSRVCRCHCGLLEGRVWSADEPSRATWSSWTSRAKCGSAGT
jgi:hypothetical protein